jgi:hypothetical protein
MDPANSWREEKQSAWLYRALAHAEKDSRIATLFLALADAADSQAATWEQAARSAGQALPQAFEPSSRARLVAVLARRLGPRRVRPALAALKVRGLSAYTAALGGHLLPTDLAQVGLSHRSVGGGNLRAAIFGINDGLVSNASLILGVVGAQAGTGTVLATGIAGASPVPCPWPRASMCRCAHSASFSNTRSAWKPTSCVSIPKPKRRSLR